MPTVVFDLATNDDSQWVFRHGTGYPPEGTITATPNGVAFVSKNLDNFEIGLGVFRYDTSAIPDSAVVTSAALRTYVDGVFDSNGRSLTGGWMTDAAISTADYTDTVETTALSPVLISSIPNPATTDFALNDAAANINKTGYTKLRLMISGGLPDNYNIVNIPLLEHATLDAPQLVVTYGLPGRRYKRLVGPQQLGTSEADLYEVPGGTRTRVRHIHLSNPGASEVDVSLEIEGVLSFERPVAAGDVYAARRPIEVSLAAGDVISGYASDTGVVVVIDGVEEAV